MRAHEHQWVREPVDETLGDDARALTVSVVDRTLHGWWEAMAQLAGIPRRRWLRHHPAPSSVIALVDGAAAFDAAAWERFASLLPGAVAMPTRTAQMMGLERSQLRPPQRPPVRFVDLWRARRMQRRIRRGERSFTADVARFRARLSEQRRDALADGEDGTPFRDLPAYALASRFEALLRTEHGWETTAVIELASADATARAVRSLAADGGDIVRAFDQLTRLIVGSGVVQLEHVEALAACDGANLDAWLDTYGWYAMRDLLLEAVPFHLQRDSVERWRTQLRDHPAPRREPEAAPDAPPGAAAQIARLRTLTHAREELARDRADLHATLRALAWTLGDRLARDGALASTDAVFDLELHDLLAVARGATAPPVSGTARGHVQMAADVELGDVVHGVPASAGTAAGRIVVVDEPAPGIDVDGAVLVCRSTDPAWLPLLMRCAAIVTERGDPLSHAAIVARELRIPAVVGVTSARARAREATHARVDGTTGRIEFDPT